MAVMGGALSSILDTMTGIIMDGFVATGLKGDFEEAKGKVRAFLNENMGRLEVWVKTHPGKRPPIYFVEETGEVVWLNRTQVRRAMRKRARDQRRAALGLSKTSGPSRKNSRLVRKPPSQKLPKEVADEDATAPTTAAGDAPMAPSQTQHHETGESNLHGDGN